MGTLKETQDNHEFIRRFSREFKGVIHPRSESGCEVADMKKYFSAVMLYCVCKVCSKVVMVMVPTRGSDKRFRDDIGHKRIRILNTLADHSTAPVET